MSDNFKKLISLLINANIKFYIGKLHENYHIVGYRERTSGVQKILEVDDRPKNLCFYDLVNDCWFPNLSFEEVIKYIFITEKNA